MKTLTFNVTIKVEDGDMPKVKAALLNGHVIPEVEDPENPGEYIPAYTIKRYVEKWLRRRLLKRINNGITRKAKHTRVLLTNVIFEEEE